MSREVCPNHAKQNCIGCDPSSEQERDQIIRTGLAAGEIPAHLASPESKPEPERYSYFAREPEYEWALMDNNQEVGDRDIADIYSDDESVLKLICKALNAHPEQESEEEELKANTELGKKLLVVWIDHCSEDASSGDEGLMADLEDGMLLFEAITALNAQSDQVAISEENHQRLGVLAVKHCPKEHHDWSEVLKLTAAIRS